MNLVGLLAGDIVGNVTTELTSKFIDKMMPAQTSRFLDIFKKTAENQKLTLTDFNLSQEEATTIIEMREFALNKGLDSIELEIDGKRYELNTQDFTFAPVALSNN